MWFDIGVIGVCDNEEDKEGTSVVCGSEEEAFSIGLSLGVWGSER
jgi:hypothetical protein